MGKHVRFQLHPFLQQTSIMMPPPCGSHLSRFGFFFSGRNRSGNRFGWLSAVNQHLLLSSFKRFQMYRFVDVYVCVFCFKDLFKIKLFWVHCNHEVPVFNICITSMTLVPLNTRTGILLHGRSKWLARPQGH